MNMQVLQGVSRGSWNWGTFSKISLIFSNIMDNKSAILKMDLWYSQLGPSFQSCTKVSRNESGSSELTGSPENIIDCLAYLQGWEIVLGWVKIPWNEFEVPEGGLVQMKWCQVIHLMALLCICEVDTWSPELRITWDASSRVCLWPR